MPRIGDKSKWVNSENKYINEALLNTACLMPYLNVKKILSFTLRYFYLRRDSLKPPLQGSIELNG